MTVIRVPSVLINLILSLFGLLLILVLLETGARIWLSTAATPDEFRQYALYSQIDPSVFRWTAHHYLNYYPSPNYNKDGTYHNSLGYRNDEFPVKKPEGVYRIVALGGSTVYTEKVKDNAKTFTAQLEAVLRDQYGYSDVQVINAGVPGYNSWESLINFEFRVLDLEPDLVLIYQNTNDVHARLVIPATYRGDNFGTRRQWHEPPIAWWENSVIMRIASRKLRLTRQVRLADFVDAPTTLENAGGDPLAALQQNPPVYFQRNLANMVALANQNQVKLLLATWAHSPDFGDYASTAHYQQTYSEHNSIILNLGDSHNIPVLDFAAVMSQSAEFWADGRHMNEAGALLKAELFAAFIHDAKLGPQ